MRAAPSALGEEQGERPWWWEAVLPGGPGPRWVRREETCSCLLSRSPQMWVALLVCRLGLPLLRARFVGMEYSSSNVQSLGIKARSCAPYCSVCLQNCCPFPRFLLAWRRAKSLLAHLPLAVTAGRLTGVTPNVFLLTRFSSDYFSFYG